MNSKLAVVAVFCLMITSCSFVFAQIDLLGTEVEPVAAQGQEMRVYYVFTVEEDVIYATAQNQWSWNTVRITSTTKSGKISRDYRSVNNTNQVYFTIRQDMDAVNATHLVAVKIGEAKDVVSVLKKGWLPEEKNLHAAPIEPGHAKIVKGKYKYSGTKVVVNDCPANIAKDNANVKIAGFCFLSHGNDQVAIIDDEHEPHALLFGAYDICSENAESTVDGERMADKDIFQRMLSGASITFCGCNTGGEWSEGDVSLANQVAHLFREKNIKVRGRIESGPVHNHYSHGMAYQYFLNDDGQSYRLEKGYELKHDDKARISQGKVGDQTIVVDGQTFQK